MIGRVLVLVLILSALGLAQSNSLDSVLVQMLNRPSDQWVVILDRADKAFLKREDVIPAIKRTMHLAVKGKDREAGEMMRAIDYVDYYLTGKTEYQALGQLTLATYFLQQHIAVKAQPVLDALLQAHPENSDGWVLQGHADLETDPLRAIQMFQKAAELDPKNEGAFMGLGQACMMVGKNSDAMKAYQKAVAINPDNPMAKEAIKFLRNPKAAQANTATTAEGARHFQLAEGFYAKGKYPEAIKEYDLAIKADKRFSKAWVYKGDAYYQMKNFDKALECYRQGIKFDPKDKQAWRKVGDVLERRFLKSGDKLVLEESISAYQKAVSLDPNYTAAQDDMARALKLRDQK